MPSKQSFLRTFVLDSLPHIDTADRAQLATANNFKQLTSNIAQEEHLLMGERMRCVAGDLNVDDDPWKWSENCKSTHSSQLERRPSIASPRRTLILPSLELKAMPSTSLLIHKRVSLVHSSTTPNVNTVKPQSARPNTSTQAALVKRRAKLPMPLLADMGRGLAFFALCVLYGVALLFVARFVNVPVFGRLVALGMHAIESGVSRKTGSRQITAMQVYTITNFLLIKLIQITVLKMFTYCRRKAGSYFEDLNR